MDIFSRFIYAIFIHFYGIAIRIASFLNPKAALWVQGRKNYFERLKTLLQSKELNRENRKLAWFHCASLGEFEQGRPIIEAFRQQYPNPIILLTFFSPSGYEIRKNYTGADIIFYLPLDTHRNAKRFVELVKPDIVFYIKYEFWFNILSTLQAKSIPLFLVSAIFRPQQHFFQWYGVWPRKILQGFTHIFVQNESSLQLLQLIGLKNASIGGDTRFDRVAALAQNPSAIEKAKLFSEGHNVLVAGSTWPADEELIIRLLNENLGNLRCIIAPHEIHENQIIELQKRFQGKAARFSEADEQALKTAHVLIIDSVGMLSQLYQYGALAYIGGGFGVGIHNILEAAVFGLPVLFGPHYSKFKEANDLLRLGGAFSIETSEGLKAKATGLLLNPEKLKAASRVCAAYVQENTGATEKVMSVIKV